MSSTIYSSSSTGRSSGHSPRSSQPGRPAQGGPARSGRPAGSGRPRSRSGSKPRTPSVAQQVAPVLADTRSPRPPVATFAAAGLPAALLRTLTEQNMSEPFPIQAATLPDALAGEHVLGRAQTGAGKTLGFGLPLLARLADQGARPKPMRPRALILVPTRELAQQVADALAPLAKPLRLRLTTVYGGASIGKQAQSLRAGTDVVVATPGRLTDLIERQWCSLEDVSITVLDEADHMCDLGFLPVVRTLLSQTPADGQRLLFSATLDKAVGSLVTEFLPSPVLVAVDPEVSAVTAMEHRAYEVLGSEAKFDLVSTLAGGLGKTLLFTRTKHGADRLAKQLTRAGIPTSALHGGHTQATRTRALGAFSGGGRRALVATDVAARGIHVDNVDLVVHVDPPNDPKAYLHRSGRTARAGAGGTVVTVSTPEQRREVELLLRAAGVGVRPTPGNPSELRALVGPAAEKEFVADPIAPVAHPARGASPVPAARPRGGAASRSRRERTRAS